MALIFKPSGTLNIATSPGKLSEMDMQRCKNMVLDRTGRAQTRNGHSKIHDNVRGAEINSLIQQDESVYIFTETNNGASGELDSSGVYIGRGITQAASGTTYATINNANIGSNITLSSDLLTATKTGNGQNCVVSTIGKYKGKWYCEFTYTNFGSSNANDIGVGNESADLNRYIGADSNSWGGEHYSVGPTIKLYTGAVYQAAYGSGIPTGAVIGVALNMDSGKVWFSTNGVWGGTSPNYTLGDPVNGLYPAFSGLSGKYLYPMAKIHYTGDKVVANFGQTSFVYSPPAGYNSGFYE